MAYRFKGHARINSNSPEANGLCDRCGFLWNLSDLKWQHDWAGNAIIRLNLRVCPTCLDPPTPAYKATITMPDGLPVADPRPRSHDQNDYRVTDTGALRVTGDGALRVTDDGTDWVLDN